MNRFGKGFKNRFLAMALAGAMVMSSVASSGMPVFAAQTTDVESAGTGTSWDETKDGSEEAAEDEEVKQKDTEENETELQENKKTETEPGTTAKKESTTAKEEVATEVEETEELETDSEDAEELQTDAVDNKAVIYTSDSAALAEGHTYAKWGLNETAVNEDGTSATSFEGKKGIYKNADGDIIYIDAGTSDSRGKFNPETGQVRFDKTKIYIPVIVENNKAKIILYQKSISDQNNVIYSEGISGSSLILSGTGFVSAQCSAFAKSGDAYRTELTCNLTGDKESAIICVEVKGADNYISQIISGKEVNDDIYDEDTGNSKDLVKYNMEGYANAYGVSGGGMLKDTASSYYKVSNAVGFLEALTKVKEAGKPAVIEVTGDLNLGSKELGKDANNEDNLSKYSSIIGADKFQALWHPTLKTSGVSDLTLEGFNNLTVFSSSDKGSAIKHCNIVVKKSTNIIFRNFSFDELWEWDDGGTVEAEKATYVRGGYKRNDWDYLCIDSESDGIWIDHCTFYKSYDGLIDIKNPKTNGEERVTISWCKFEPKSAPSENGTHPFFDEQLDALEKDYQSGDPKAIYYKSLRTTEAFDYTYTKYSNKVGTQTTETFKGEGYSLDDIVIYTCGQKKAHLLGQGDDVENAVGIRVTFANNSWVNCMDRLPRLRRGIAHEYNCVLDASELYNAKNAGSKAKSHLVSNGAISTVDGSVFLENCYIDGIDKPLLSGNSGSNRGYIGFEDCIYKHGEDRLEVICNTTDNTDKGKDPLTLTKAQFKEKLPASYGSYQLYAADDLKTKVLPYAGAGSVKMSAIQWTKTSYGDGTSGGGDDDDNPPTDPKNPPAGYEDSLILNANDLVVEEITKTVKLNDHYTIIGASDGAVTIKGITQTTINEKPFTKAINLSGSGSAAKSAIAIAAPKAGKLIVYSTGTPVLKTGSEEPQNGNSTVTGITEYAIDAAGTYYLYSSGSGSDVYYIEFSDQTQGPSGEIKTETLKFRATNLEAKKLTDDLKVDDYFTVKIASEIESKPETQIAGEKLTNRVKFSGAGSNESMSIQIKALGEGTLTVYAVSGNTSTERTLKLLDSEGKPVNGAEANIKEAAAVTIQVPGKGIYYLVSAGSGINVYGIDFEVTYREGETLPEDPSSSDEDFPTYTTPEGGERYGANEGKESNCVKYNMEGYAASANVTGGGLLKDEGNEGYYYKVSDEKQFLEALKAIQNNTDKPHVIEITTDLNLGNKELNKKYEDEELNISSTSGSTYSSVIRAYGENQAPLIHPTLKETGVSWIKLHNFHNLTIFSKNGATIKHAGLVIEGSSTNIIIRNLVFDELWEWDDIQDDKGKYGSYDRNDWDYIAIQDSAEGIWIDHCTFYKAYDGVIDIKEGKKGYQRVTISWCEFLPGSENNTFFNEQMKALEKDIENTEYYKQLRQTENMSKEDVFWYAYGQKKTHLFGDDDKNVQDKAIRATLANNYYKNSMDRMPRLRYGIAHEYNCVLDAQNLYTKKHSGNSGLSSHITNQGAISTCGGQMLLENCYIRGIQSPLYSGNGSSPTGYNKAIQSVHYLDGNLVKAGTLEPIKNGSGSGTVLTTNETEFKEALPYSDYITRDATKLYSEVVPNAGAGKVSMSTVQWERTNYGDRTGNESSSTSAAPAKEPAGPNDDLPKTPWDESENPDNPDDPPADTIAAPTATPADGTQFPSGGGPITLDCETDGVTIYYTKSATESGLTDPADANNTNRVEYTAPIEIKEETYIWAVAIKDGKASEPLKCHYTVLAEGAIVKPTANPGSETQPTEVLSGTKVALNVTDDTIENIYYTMGSAPNDPREENSGRHTYSDEITITEATTIKAVAQKGDKYSDIAVFTYTIKADVDPDPDKTVAAPTFSKAGGAVEKGEKITIACTTEGASIYYTTNGNEPKAESQFLYTKGTEIVINETTTIRAIAVKDGVSSKESKVTYTVNNEEIPPEIKTIKLSECTITVPSVMESTKKGWVPQSVTYVTYKYTNENGQTRYVKFAEGVDYDVDWTPGKQEDGTYKVILTGRGRTTDGRSVDGYVIDENSTEAAFYMVYKKPEKNSEIKLVDISKAKVSLDKNAIKNLCYTGYAHEPDLDYSKDKDGLEGKLNIAYKNNINAGKASVIISAKPGADTDTVKYVGSKTLTFTVKKAALNKNEEKATALVSFDKDASERQQYISGAVTAKGLKVETVVTSGNRKGVTLRKDEDYTVTYKNSVKNGTVTVTMTVKGVGNNLSGNCAKTFTMEQLDLTDVSLTEGNGGKLPYSSKGAKLGTITVTKDGSTCTLKEGVDYTAKYEYDKTKKKDAGSNVKITVKGKGVCKGQSTATFDIVQADFNSADIIISEDVTVDTDNLAKCKGNSDKEKAVYAKAFTVKDAAGAKLNANKDYTISVNSNEKKITITPTGKNAANYKGTKTFPYREAKNLAKDKNFIFDKNLDKNDPLGYDGRNPVKLTTADIDKYINNDIKPTDPAYSTRTYRLGGQNANIEIVPGTYKNNTKKGTAQVTVKGIAGVDGGFYGQKVLKFKIAEK